jgi:hypothetical protein
MKINSHAWQVWRVRLWAGRLALLGLVLAELWMVCRFGAGCGRGFAPAGMGNVMPGLGDCVTAR